MSDNNNLPQKRDSAELALHKTRSLLSITNKILANKTLVVSDDAWLDELIAWADENDISEDDFPRNKQEILAMTELHLHRYQLRKLPESIGGLITLTKLDLSFNKLTKLPNSIEKLINLTELYLWGNPIIEISKPLWRIGLDIYLGGKKKSERICNKIEKLLYKESEDVQQEMMKEMERMIWDSYNIEVRTENPMAFCLDLQNGLDFIDDWENIRGVLSDEGIIAAGNPLELV